MAIGDGLCDPVTMTNYGDFLFNIGLIDEMDRDYFKKISKIQVDLINKKQWVKAFQVIKIASSLHSLIASSRFIGSYAIEI